MADSTKQAYQRGESDFDPEGLPARNPYDMDLDPARHAAWNRGLAYAHERLSKLLRR